MDLFVRSGVKAQSHYDAGGAPLRDPRSTGINRGSNGDDRDEQGKTGAPPGITGKDRQRPVRHRKLPGRHQEQLGRYRSFIGLWQRPGGAPVNAVRVHLKLRYISKPALCRDATDIHRGSAEALSVTTGAKPSGECRRCYGIPGLCRDPVGFYRGTTGDGALPGLHRDKP
ncbi:hypothetical protein DPMN_118887 [Dreissena polymorpha]|uniref:Uncharacterized protein n=1 Tax=Dreissena polymorpha TaxID=45954 RepID=A0A9D4JNX5_DREPO|nr:hypothetical protein DPMN_118887 [Dreissena polymorpha]